MASLGFNRFAEPPINRSPAWVERQCDRVERVLRQRAEWVAVDDLVDSLRLSRAELAVVLYELEKRGTIASDGKRPLLPEQVGPFADPIMALYREQARGHFVVIRPEASRAEPEPEPEPEAEGSFTVTGVSTQLTEDAINDAMDKLQPGARKGDEEQPERESDTEEDSDAGD